jgi:glyoxylase-like metal-dependent hydrolase (beta-lactamase superfamily II)
MLRVSQLDEVTRFDSTLSVAGRGYYWTTFYYLDGLLIDTGCAHTAINLRDCLQGKEINLILNTHSHEDHIGANGVLQEAGNEIKILAHPLALPVLLHPRDAQPLQFYRQVFWGWPAPSHAHAVEDGESITTRNHAFTILYTPGHSPDHLCLYEPDKGWLFTGDLFVGGRDRGVVSGCNIWQTIDSLKMVARLPLTRMFPGSARTRDHPHDDLSVRINYLQETGEKVLDLHKNGWSIDAIAREVFGGPMLIEFITRGHFSRRNLVLSYLHRQSEHVPLMPI